MQTSDHNVTGLIGQYAHGNEPSHHVTYLYALAGRPERTQDRYSIKNNYMKNYKFSKEIKGLFSPQ